MKRLCENILTPINKLFTYFKKRIAHSNKRTTPMVPSSLPGIMLLRPEAAVGQEGSRPGTSRHQSTHWLRLSSPGHGRGFFKHPNSCRYQRPHQPQRSTCSSLPPNTGSTPVLLGEALSMPVGPLTLSHSQDKDALQASTDDMGTLQTHLGSRRAKSSPPRSHRSHLSLSHYPHLKIYSVSGQDPRLGHKFLQVRRSPLVFSTSKQDQRGHTDAEDRVLALARVVRFSPLEGKWTTVKGSGLHSVAQLCSLISAPQK